MVAVEVRSVAKRFRLSAVSQTTTLKSTVTDLFRSRRRHPDSHVTVLRDISLTVRTAQTIGIIGRNGSGKSTLLKLIAGIYRPDAGTIRTRGRLAPLLELGAGFHPEFSGRENILINGILLGLSRREIKERLDAIVRFAELESYIDEPVRTYSSGMYMRLGFAVAVHTSPDILLIDELLAVGDERFQQISAERIRAFQRQGKSIILVTHDLHAIESWCDEVVWIDDGVVHERGAPGAVVRAYLSANTEATQRGPDVVLAAPAAISADDSSPWPAAAPADAEPAADGAGRDEPPADALAAPSGDDAGAAAAAEGPEFGRRWGTGAVSITAVRLSGPDGRERSVFWAGDPMVVELTYAVGRPIEELVVGFAVVRDDGVCCYGTNTAIEGLAVPHGAEGGRVQVVLERLDLITGQYFLDVAVHPVEGEHYDYHHGLHPFMVRSSLRDVGVAHVPHRWRFETTASADHEPAAARGADGAG